MAIPLKPTECKGVIKARCTTPRVSDCTGQVYDDRTPTPCGTVTESGGAGVTRKRHSLGDTSGTVNIAFNAYGVPDRMDVYIGGVLVATTGRPVGTDIGDVMPWPLSFVYDADGPNYCTVVVTGPDGTGWQYSLDCPV